MNSHFRTPLDAAPRVRSRKSWREIKHRILKQPWRAVEDPMCFACCDYSIADDPFCSNGPVDNAYTSHSIASIGCSVGSSESSPVFVSRSWCKQTMPLAKSVLDTFHVVQHSCPSSRSPIWSLCCLIYEPDLNGERVWNSVIPSCVPGVNGVEKRKLSVQTTTGISPWRRVRFEAANKSTVTESE